MIFDHIEQETDRIICEAEGISWYIHGRKMINAFRQQIPETTKMMENRVTMEIPAFYFHSVFSAVRIIHMVCPYTKQPMWSVEYEASDFEWQTQVFDQSQQVIDFLKTILSETVVTLNVKLLQEQMSYFETVLKC